VSSAKNYSVGGVGGDTVPGEEGEEGLSTQPCGVPEFMITVSDVRFPILTFCGLLVRKSIIHEQSELDSPRFMSLWGATVLNALLKSTKSILT